MIYTTYRIPLVTSFLLISGCYAARPTQRPPVSAPAAKAPTSSIAADPPAKEPADPKAPAAASDDSSSNDQPSNADRAAKEKAETFAKKFTWTKSPSASLAPHDGVVVGVGNEGSPASVSIQWDKKKREWSFRVKGASSADLGPQIDLKGTPKAGRTYTVKYGEHSGFFQAPQHGKKTATKFDETTSINADNAYVIKLTALKLSKDGASGTASGRFAIVFDNFDGPKLWAAGTFTGAPVVVFK